jgi:energy-coupling factor transporter transmembrane protein EcfT
MAELTPFSYRPGKSFFHRSDVRCKLICFSLVSLSSLNAQAAGLGLLTFFLFIAMIHIRLSFRAVLWEMRYFLILLAFVFAARALSTPGEAIADLMIATVTKEGCNEGTLVCWRLLTVTCFALAFVSTTRTTEIKAGVYWFLKPLPFIPAKRVATMLGLTIRFIPMILNQIRETADAQRARGIENRKNPVYRMVKFIIPLMRRTFEDADKLILAMEARCWSENRTDPELSFGKSDWSAVLAAAGFFILMITM